MDRTNIIKANKNAVYYGRYFLFYLQKNAVKIVLCILTVLSVYIGAAFLSSYDADTLKQIMLLLNGYLDGRNAQAFADNFIHALLPTAIMLLITFFCGFCAISAPILFLVPIFKGLGFGLSVGCIFAVYKGASILYVSLFMLPNMLISSYVIVLSCTQAIRFSNACFRAITGGASQLNRREMNLYCIRFLCYLVAITVFALLDATIFALFSHTVTLG